MEDKKAEEYVKEEKLEFPNDLLNNPYEYICNIYEKKYPHLGKKIFSVLCLSPVSLIIPKVKISNIKTTNRTLSILWLAPPATGKTTISRAIEKITINPICSHRITPARLIYEVKKVEGNLISLLISDIAVSFSDETFVKLVESIVEDGYAHWDTMQNKKDEGSKKKYKAFACLSGTPQTISNNKIRDGILGRCFPILLYLTEKQEKDILRKIAEGEENGIDESIKKIEEFYKKLIEFKENNKIDGFEISEKIKLDLLKYIEDNKALNLIFKKWGIPRTRQFEDAYIILTSLSFLNIFNRKIVDNKICVEERDLKITKKLVNRGAIHSYRIYEAIEKIDWYKIKNERQLREYLTKNNISKGTKFLMEGLIKK